jgi:hypothetical protein
VKKFIVILWMLLIAHNRLSAQAEGNIVVVISPELPAVDVLINEMHPDSRVVFFNAAEDPVSVITNALKANAPVSALHILTEASSGTLLFPGDNITTDTLLASEEMLGAWKQYFALHGDILLYGCELAKGDAGMTFIRNLAVLTGLDIAASEDMTGSSREHGDWKLEVRSGNIESRLAVSRNIFEVYPTILRNTSQHQTSRRNKRTIHEMLALGGKKYP